MPNVNKVILIGHLTRDPQLKYLPSQMALAEFGIAVNREFRTKSGEEREEVAFVDCSCFGKGAEILSKYVQKGNPLYVEGRLKYDSWDDKQSGAKRQKLSVIVESFQFLGSRGDVAADETTDQRQPQDRSVGGGSKVRKYQPAQPPFGDENVFNPEDVPF